MIAKGITFFGNPCVLICDAKCHKAWGINNRPRVYLEDPELRVYPNEEAHYPDEDTIDLDNYAHLADGELGDAPIDPGIYEGGHAKPKTPEERLNKWCARECERSSIVDYNTEFELDDLSQRFYNCQPHTRPEGI